LLAVQQEHLALGIGVAPTHAVGALHENLSALELDLADLLIHGFDLEASLQGVGFGVKRLDLLDVRRTLGSRKGSHRQDQHQTSSVHDPILE
jgi:hypothetical protein